MKATYWQKGEVLDFTPTADVKNGQVVPIGSRVGVAGSDIAANEQGHLHVVGVFEMDKAANEAITMDDYYMIFPTREEAERVSAEVIRRAEERGFQINRKKSRIVPLDKPFRFCKVKFELTETGAVKTHGCRDGMKRARRKLRLYKRKVDAGEATTKEVWEWLQSQIAYYKKFNDHGRVLRLLRLYHAIFGGANHVQNQ